MLGTQTRLNHANETYLNKRRRDLQRDQITKKLGQARKAGTENQQNTGEMNPTRLDDDMMINLGQSSQGKSEDQSSEIQSRSREEKTIYPRPPRLLDRYSEHELIEMKKMREELDHYRYELEKQRAEKEEIDISNEAA